MDSRFMTRWLRLLTPFALVILVGHMGYNGFQVYRLRAQWAEERLRAGMESLLRAGGPLQRRVLSASGEIDGGEANQEPLSGQLVSAVQTLIRNREKGRPTSHAFRDGDRVVLLRWAGSTPSAVSAFAILENRSALSTDLFDGLATLDRDLARSSERALYRLTAVSDSTRIFEDEAYRLSVSRCEDLLKEQEELIESAEAEVLPAEEAEPFRKRRELRNSIEMDRRRLRAINLSETEVRLPVLKGIRAKEKEMAALPAPHPTVTGEALRSFVWQRIAEALQGQQLIAESDPLLSSREALRRWAFSAGGGSRAEAHRRALEVFMAVHQAGLVASATELVHTDTPEIEMLVGTGVAEMDSPLVARLKTRAAIFLALAAGDLLVAVLWLFFTRGLRRSIRGVSQ